MNMKQAQNRLKGSLRAFGLPLLEKQEVFADRIVEEIYAEFEKEKDEIMENISNAYNTSRGKNEAQIKEDMQSCNRIFEKMYIDRNRA